jgi:hypothetical protein
MPRSIGSGALIQDSKSGLVARGLMGTGPCSYRNLKIGWKEMSVHMFMRDEGAAGMRSLHACACEDPDDRR